MTVYCTIYRMCACSLQAISDHGMWQVGCCCSTVITQCIRMQLRVTATNSTWTVEFWPICLTFVMKYMSTRQHDNVSLHLIQTNWTCMSSHFLSFISPVFLQTFQHLLHCFHTFQWHHCQVHSSFLNCNLHTVFELFLHFSTSFFSFSCFWKG